MSSRVRMTNGVYIVEVSSQADQDAYAAKGWTALPEGRYINDSGSGGSGSQGPKGDKGDAAPKTGNWAAADHGLVAWSVDPVCCTTGQIFPAAGTLIVVKVHVPVAATINNIITYVNTAGAGLTAGQCGAALYDAAGNKLGQTGDLSGTWASVGLKTSPLASPVAVAAGDYYVAFWANGTTLPTVLRGPAINVNLTNVGLSAGAYRSATANTGVTTTAPATLGAMTTSASFWWVALN